MKTKNNQNPLLIMHIFALFYREISYLHTEALARFWSGTNLPPSYEFPALHRELFPTPLPT